MGIGIQSQKFTQDVMIFGLNARITCYKAIGHGGNSPDFLGVMKRELPGLKSIYRPYFASQPLDNPLANAKAVYEAVMPTLTLGVYDYVEAYCEPKDALWEKAEQYNSFTMSLANMLGGEGQKLLAYSWGVGCPPGYASFPYEKDPPLWLQKLGEHWVVYMDGLREVKKYGGGLALHEYKLPNHLEAFTSLRHRFVRKVLPQDLVTIPIYNTELGLDKSGSAGDGWKGPVWNWSPKQMATWIKAYARATRRELTHSTLFLCGYSDPRWITWDVRNKVIEEAIREVNEEEAMTQDYHIEAEVPNQEDRDPGTKPDLVIIHCTRSGLDHIPDTELQRTLTWFKDPESEASAHLVQHDNGDWWYCVPWTRKAYGAGYLNNRALHIELVQAKADVPFSDIAIQRLGDAVVWLCGLYGIPKVRVMDETKSGIIGHEDTAQGRAAGKSDPGPMFDWPTFMRSIGGEIDYPNWKILYETCKRHQDEYYRRLENVKRAARGDI